MPTILTVCASSTFEQLASKEKLKAVLSVTTSNDDDLMDDILDRVTVAAETFVGRCLRKQTYLETVAGHGDLYLVVSSRPVQSITSILDGEAVVESTSYSLVNPLGGMIYRTLGWKWTAGTITELIEHVVPGSELNKFAIEYVGGYVPSSATSTQIGVPRDIEGAVIEAAKSWYLGRKQSLTISEKTVGDLRLRYSQDSRNQGGGGEPALPSRVEAILSPYQSVF